MWAGLKQRFRRQPTWESQLAVALGFVPILWWAIEAEPPRAEDPIVTSVLVILVYAAGAAVNVASRWEWPQFGAWAGLAFSAFIGWNLIGGLRFVIAGLIALFVSYLLMKPIPRLDERLDESFGVHEQSRPEAAS